MMQISDRMQGVSESATLKLNALVQAMKAEGVDLVNLSAGEPDFPVHERAKEAVVEALKANRSKYTPVAGIPELRSLIAERTNKQQPSAADQTPWEAADVVVSNGGKQALFDTFFCILNPGDEVLIPVPYWLSYPEMVKMAGGTATFIHASVEQDFKIRPQQLREALTPGHTRMIVFNSPSNPTGAMYSREEYRALGEVIRNAPGGDKIWIVSDEIYDRISFSSEPFCSFLEACPEMRHQVVTVNGMSKSYSMTGWRIGWSVAPRRLTSALLAVQGQSTSGINALAQWASVAALKLPESEFASQVQSYRRRRDLTLEILAKAGKLKVVAPQGAFYVFVGAGECMRSGEDSIGFCERVLKEAKVALVPGSPFGAPEYFRISFATDEATLQEGCGRLVRYLS